MTETKSRLDDLRIDDEARPRSGSKRGAVFALTLLLLVASATAGWWWWRSSSVPEVRTATAREAVSSETGAGTVLEASGYVTARRQATVSSKITGKVVEVLVEEGMKVSEGQVLARLDDSLISRELKLSEAQLAASRSALDEIEVRLEEARINLARTERLAAEEVVSQAQLDADKAVVESLEARLANTRDQVDVSESQVEYQRQRLEDTLIRAPFTGVAISKDAQPGEMISPVTAGGGFTRTGICTIVDMGSLEVEVDVNESYINRVTEGQPVVATLDSYPDWKIPSRVITTIPAADRQKATVRVRIAFDELDPRILPDMGVNVSFLEAVPDDGDGTAAAARPRVTVPREALDRDGEQDVVWVVTDGAVERRAVTLGARSVSEVEVTAGLSGGEQVVVEGPEDLSPGQEVEVVTGGGR